VCGSVISSSSSSLSDEASSYEVDNEDVNGVRLVGKVGVSGVLGGGRRAAGIGREDGIICVDRWSLGA